MFIIIIWFLPVHPVILNTIILLYSIKNPKIGLAIFLIITLIGDPTGDPTEWSMQEALMVIILLTYFIIRIKLNFKYISILIILFVFIGYFMTDEIVLFTTVVLDPSAGWRLMLWTDNIKSTVNDTFLIGHGFGTTYFAAKGRNPGEFIDLYPIWKNSMGSTLLQYGSMYKAEFLLPQHNSFINIFYRLGIIGLFLFLSYLNSIAKKIKFYGGNYQQLNFILLLSMLIIGVNVGLESPGNCIRFVFIISIIQNFINRYSNSNNQSILLV